jgi:hypothetical protein
MRGYSDTVRSPRESVLPLTVFGGATVAVWISGLYGVWWLTTVAGVIVGLFPLGSRRCLAVAAGAGATGWALALLWLALGEDVRGAASVIAGIMGFGRHGVIVIVLVLILAALFAVIGAWIGIAARRLLEMRFADPFGQL